MNGSWACPGGPVAEHHERGVSVHLVEASVLMGFGKFLLTNLDGTNALRVYPSKDGHRPCANGGLPRARRGCAD